MNKFRKKPVEIEAVQWTGTNQAEIAAFYPDVSGAFGSLSIFVQTLEGCMEAKVGDWIIRGVKGEFYPCRDDIFRLTYDPV